MGRNEIRLRRQLMSSGRIARHRNYSELMRQHDKEVRLKRVLRVFIYFLIILFLLILLLIVIRWEGKQKSKSASKQVITTTTLTSAMNQDWFKKPHGLRGAHSPHF